MILVLLGTQNNSFHRLLEEIDKNIENGNIKEEVVVQAGYTKYEPVTKKKKMKIFDTIPKKELEKLIEKANLVISHGGVGSMVTANQKGKKVIAVPRYKKYNEHVNDHQIETIKIFESKGYVMLAENVLDLSKVLEKARDFKPVIYKKDEKSNIIGIIEEFIG
jgi:UDP-N-acetylglucosamine transferase subunit ALG13